MTKYYSNQPDFSTEAPDPAYNYFSSMSDIMDNIEAAGNTVKSEGVEDLYTQKGEAALGVKKDSSIFDKSIQRIYNMLNSAKKVHSDIMQNIDNKFTRGMDDAFKSLNNVNGDKKPYESKYTKKDTIKYKQEAGPNGFEQRAYNDPQPYKLHELLDGKASPIEAAKDVYETRLQAAKAYLAQKDKLTDKEIKNLEGKSAEDIVEAYFPSQIPDYQGLKASRFQEENKDTLQKVDIGLKALAFLAAAGGVIFAPFTSGASLTLTYASGAYLFADNAYSAWTGQTMITGDRLSTEDRVWAGIDAATTLASMGSLAYLTKFGTSGPNLLKNLATLGKYADDANDVSKVFYAAATDQDPSSAIQNLVIGQVASFGVGKASNYFGGKFSRGGTPDLDVDLPGAKASHLDVPLQSKQIPKLDPANVRLSSRPDLHLKASPADTTLAKLKPHPTVSVDVPKVKQVSGDSATKAIGGVKPSDVDVPKVKNNISEPNFANYKEFSTKKIDEFKTNLNDVETKITVETRNAAGEIQRIQLKAVGIDETGKIRIQDYTTAKDGLSIKRQTILDNIERNGGVIVGKGNGKFVGSVEIPKRTRIDVINSSNSKIKNFKMELEKIQRADMSRKIVDGLISTEKGQRLDPSRYLSHQEIETHLNMFKDGVVKVISKEGFNKSVMEFGGNIGPEKGHYVMPKFIYDKAVLASDGNPRVLEELLGLDRGYLGDSPLTINVKHPKNLRMPSGNEPGAWQDLWEPGGFTKGGIPEAVVDQFKPGDYTIGKIFE